MDIFSVLFYQPTFNLLILFTNWFGSLGLSIVLIALIAKLITLPMTSSQIKNAEKSKKMQVKFKELKKKYKHNQEKLTKEMAKLQAEVLPGQLGGCLSIIVFIILFVQIRGVILDLVNRGYHAFNEVAYTESLEKKEDFIKYNLSEPLSNGRHIIEVNVTASNGKNLNKVYEFEVVEDKEIREIELKKEMASLSDQEKEDIRKLEEERAMLERESNISVYNKDIDSSVTNVVLGQFLFFTTEAQKVNLLTSNMPDLTFYMRGPSNERIVSEETTLMLDGIYVTDNIEIQQGETLGLDFLGVNLSKVANDFEIFDLAVTAPYILISVFSGITQYFVTKLYSAGSATTGDEEKKVKKDKPKKKEDIEEPDFAEVMAQSSKQMNLIFPIFTVMISLGYFGGASFIPMGVTLFWTAQNSFVIIQQMFLQRKSLKKNINEKLEGFKLYLNSVQNK